MKVIQPNCRVQFTAEDVDFIVATLGSKTGNAECLIKLLTDEDSRDLILDDEQLFHALLEHRGCLRISSHLYFYVMVRRVFKRAHIENRPVADYVAEVLAEFSAQEQTQCVLPGQKVSLDYFFEMVAAMQNADDHTRFLLSCHIGNQSLFLSGVFPERIKTRAEQRGFPDLKYYEALGRSNFKMASDHRLAQRYDLAAIFAYLAERFKTLRLALNDMTDRLISLGDQMYPVNTLLGGKA